LPLIKELCNRLIENRVEYCHWKSNAALHLSASGENDLDLLIDRGHADKFAKILGSLGFKAAIGPASRELPGIRHYYGYDWEADEFVHVHAHYQLIVGHDTTKNYRIPVERACIRSSHHQDRFRLPQPEFELVLFVVRMVLKHCPLDSLLFRESRLTQTENTELTYLTKRSDPGVLEAILNEHLPYLSREHFWQCRGAIEPGAGVMARLNAAQVLFRVLEPRARRHRQIDAMARVSTRLMKRVPTPFLDHGRKKRFLNGGRLIAFIGGDGSGKSTAVAETAKWLIRHFDVTTVHLGKPSPSLSTIVLKSLLTLLGKCGIVSLAGPGPDEILAERSGRPYGLAWVILQVLIARDRRRQYHHALRSASNGRIVITDRFPLREIRSMDGVKAGKVVDGRQGGWMLSRLVEYEQRCYDQITPPDLAYVLRIDPEVALRRRTDENPRFVRTRNMEIHRKHWISPGVKRIDAAAPIDQVTRQIKRTLWHEL
jgi:thymidylate kinase